MYLPNATTVIGTLVGLIAVIIWRVRETSSPISTKKIVIPPFGMATGFSMFFVPAFRIPWTWAGIAFLIGATVLAYPLLVTTRLEREGEAIIMRRSAAFFSVIVVLAAIRLLARGYFDKYLSMEQSGGLFFVLAFGMILHWRARMFMEYRRLIRPAAPELAVTS